MKHFNTEGVCRPDCNYMVKTDDILGEIKSLIDSNNYIILNRPRQFGKTTTLALLQKVLEPQYAYINISIEDFTESDFTERGFSKALHLIISDYFNDSAPGLSEEAKKAFLSTYEDMKDDFDLRAVTSAFKHMCLASDKRIVLAIDEIDAAEGCEAFFGLLAFLRSKYNDNPENTFQSVILVGVYDIWRLSNYRSPWNIAVYFDESLGLPKRGILEMLEEYKADHGLKFDAARMSALLSEYTSGYPFLVSKLCSIIHSELLETARFADLDAAWTREGFLAAVQILKSDRAVLLFHSLSMQLKENVELRTVIEEILYSSEPVRFYAGSPAKDSISHGFVTVVEGLFLRVANRIFETWLHANLEVDDCGFERASREISFIKNGRIDMELVFEKFSAHFNMWCKDKDRTQIEGKELLLFMAFLKPIISGTGFCHLDAMKGDRSKIAIDYKSQREIVELKLWHEEYDNERLEQLTGYLDKLNLDHGYLLVFSNLAKKEAKGRSEAVAKGKRIVTYVV